MRLIVGLGNPGLQYGRTRHNVGFMVVDRIVTAQGWPTRGRFKAETASGRWGDSDCLFLKPLTYMNLSGMAVRAALDFYRLAPADMVVIHDDIDLAFGRMQIKAAGGDAGHKGLRSIICELGQRDFPRVRLGIGRPLHGSVEDYVLTAFDESERAELPTLIDRAVQGAETLLRQGTAVAMEVFNRTSPGAVAKTKEAGTGPAQR